MGVVGAPCIAYIFPEDTTSPVAGFTQALEFVLQSIDLRVSNLLIEGATMPFMTM